MSRLWSSPTGRRLLLFVSLSLILVSFGTVGYKLIAHYPWVDALYMTVITLTTVGFGEIRPLDQAGRLFTVFLIVAGAGLIAYNIMYIGQLLTDANWLALYRRRRLRMRLERLKNHYIICGYGQMGKIIVDQLVSNHVSVLVIEQEEACSVRLKELDIPHLIGDATDEELLIEAGVERAKGLVACVLKDTDNVFIVLSARDLNRELLICARANSQGAEKKLIKAGANRVVSPYATGALRVVQNILKPNVTDFLDLALSGSGMELSMEELVLPPDNPILGKDLMHSGIRSDFNLIVVAIKPKDGGRMVYNPSHKAVLSEGDILLTIGPRDNLDRFARSLYGENCQRPSACSTDN